MAKTNWNMNDTVLPSDLNQIGQEINDNTASIASHKSAGVLDHPDNSVTDAKIGSRTINDTSAPTGNSGTVTTLLGWLANMIKSITGKSNWRTPPATTLEAAKSHMDASAPHSGHALTTRKINTGNGLTGGGDLSADRTLSVAFAGTGSANTVARSDHTHTAAEIGAETPAGAQAKANTAEQNAKDYAVNKIAAYGGGTPIDPNTTAYPYIITNHPNVPTGSGYWYIRTYFYQDTNSNRSQVAIRYISSVEMYFRKMVSGTWENWSKIWHDGILPDPARTGVNNNFSTTQSITSAAAEVIELIRTTNVSNVAAIMKNQNNDMLAFGMVDGNTFGIGPSTNLIGESKFRVNKTTGEATINGNSVWHSGNNLASFSENGYQKLANGLIIQWGRIANVPAGGMSLVTFPIAFPNAAFQAYATAEADAPTAANVGFLSLSNMRVYHSSNIERSVRWLAIGR